MSLFKKLCLPAILLVIVTCDESGRSNSEVVGLWEHVIDSIIVRDEIYVWDTPATGLEISTVEYNEDGTYEKNHIYSDTTITSTGVWSASDSYIFISLEYGGNRRYELHFDNDRMSHTYRNVEAGIETRKVNVYDRIE